MPSPALSLTSSSSGFFLMVTTSRDRGCSTSGSWMSRTIRLHCAVIDVHCKQIVIRNDGREKRVCACGPMWACGSGCVCVCVAYALQTDGDAQWVSVVMMGGSFVCVRVCACGCMCSFLWLVCYCLYFFSARQRVRV